MGDSFVRLLGESLALLDAHVPHAVSAMRRQLGSMAVVIAVDDQVASVSMHRHPPVLRGDRGSAPVDVHLPRTVFDDLLDGRLSTLDALRLDRLWMRGELTDLVAFHGALQSYVHGAVRCPGFPALLRRWRASGEED